MGEQAVVVAAATYTSRAAAAENLRTLCGEPPSGSLGHLAAAIVEKGADGRLTIERHGATTSHRGPDDLLLGAVLIVLAAPVGIAFLLPIATTVSAWAGVAALVDHVWHDIPKRELRRMSDLLEDGQAALVAVAVDRAADDVRAALTGATIAVVTDGVTADLEAEVALAIDEANANPSQTALT
jgi:uncharacterized membrane protein